MSSSIMCSVTPEDETPAEELARTRKLAHALSAATGRTPEQIEQTLKEAFGPNYILPEEMPDGLRADVFMVTDEQ